MVVVTTLIHGIHLVSVAVWTGGVIVLAFLVLAMREAGAERDLLRVVARAFGRVTWPALGIAVLTGVIDLLQRFPGQLTLETTFGVRLGVKVLLVVLVAALTVYHQITARRTTPALRGALEGGHHCSLGCYLLRSYNTGTLMRLVLLITAPDRPGLVAKTAALLYDLGGNVIHADQHTDHVEHLFLQRIEFTLGEEAADDLRSGMEHLGAELELNWRLEEVARRKVGLLASKEPHVLADLLSRWSIGELNCDIPVVIANHDVHADLVELYGVPFVYLPVDENDREGQETRSPRGTQNT